ncbi:MAG TPA: tripartite tricarboxylate transporter substrate-binding protein, partial [Devosia sp.]|nr:tripartite tricarboxylate transporter substrate-binding protein [Devosia sp.]
GSAGGADHIAAGLVVKAIGADPTQVNYIAYSGGGEALASILGGQVTVGISGASEFLPQVDAGALRAIAVTGENRIEGYDIPTLKEAGVDVTMENWRMVAAAPGITAEQQAAVSADIEKMVNGPSWQEALKTRGWANAYLSGAAFDTQLAADIEATSGILKEIGLVQ